MEASYKSYEKSLKKLPTGSAPTLSASSSSLEENPLDYGKSNAKVSKHALDRSIACYSVHVHVHANLTSLLSNRAG